MMRTATRLALVGLGVILCGATLHEMTEAQTPTIGITPVASPSPDFIPHPDLYSNNCYYAKNREVADLCAQWRAALAAEQSSDVGRWGNIVGGVSALLSLFSLFCVLASLRQTKLALRAAGKANEIAREIGEAQVRAYVAIQSARLLVTETFPVIQIDIKNSGPSPANQVIVDVYGASIFSVNFDDPQETRPKVIEFGPTRSQPVMLTANHMIPNIMIGMQPHPTADQDYTKVGAELINNKNIVFFKFQYSVKWTDVFGVACDISGSVIFDSFQPIFPHNDSVKSVYDGKVVTSVYDTVAWFKTRAGESS